MVSNSERVIFMMVEDMLSMMKMIFMAINLTSRVAREHEHEHELSMKINLTSRVARERRTRKQSNGEGTAPRYR